MNDQKKSAPLPGDDVPPSVAPRIDAPSTSGTAPPSSDPVNEIREINQRTAALEAMITSLLSSMKNQASVPAASTPLKQTSSHIPRDNENLHSTSSHHDTITSHSSAISKSAVRDALELVPKFDGHNISVFQFSRACKRAKELIPPSEEGALVRFLRGKLINHAYLAVEDEFHDTVEQILDSLKRTFSPARTPNFYRGQLSVVHKKPNEHILDYIGRVKDLRSAIIEGDQFTYGRELTSGEVFAIDTDVTESFLEGLPPSYRAEIQMDRCRTPTEAYNKAISVTKRLERDIMYAKETRAEQLPRTQFQDPRFHSSALRPTAVAREPPPVTIMRRDPNSQPAYNTRVPRNQDPFPTKICSYCQKFGHLISDCRKRQATGGNTYRTNQGNAPAASASENRGRSNQQTALPLEENPLPSTSSNSQPEESQQSN